MDKIVLSIHYGHNATVGLCVNGEIVCLLSEERINRIKNTTGFPFRALEYVIQKYLGGNRSSIDLIVLNDELLYGYQYLKNFGFQPHRYIDYYCYTKEVDICWRLPR